MSKAPFIPLQLSLGIFISLAGSPILAQVTPDNTIDTQVNQNNNIAEIMGGETRGGNLFHSFQDFSVTAGKVAFFNNANNISNIFSRVTGGNISKIDGEIRANGDANLFLINPAGIIFEENAKLNIGGSFYGSSASSILFEDGVFSAVDNLNQPILTIKAPIGLGFRDNPGDIRNLSRANDGKGLEVSSGKNLSLWGGNISFDGGTITASAGRIELKGTVEAGNVNFTEDGSLIFPDSLARGDISLTNSSLVNVAGDRGGTIAIDSAKLQLSANSQIRGGIASNSNSPGVLSGDIILKVAEAINLDRGSIINRVDPESLGNAGNIDIETNSLSLVNGSLISAETFGLGNAGSIAINATQVVIDGEGEDSVSAIASTINLDAEGMGGNIVLATDNLELTNGALVSTTTFGRGDAGSIAIEGREIAIAKNSQISSNVGDKAIGNAGNLNFQTDFLSLRDSSLISAETFGLGNAGSIDLAASGNVNIATRSRFTSNVGGQAVGNAGNLKINANSLSIDDNSSVSAETFGLGNAGSISIEADSDLVIDFASVIASTVNANAEGMGGDITISSKNLNLTNSAFISNTTFGRGNAGAISLEVAENIAIAENSQISSAVASGAEGNAGQLNIKANSLNLDGNAEIAAFVTSGEGGILNLEVIENLTLRNSSRISAEALNDSNGGNLFIDANFIIAFPQGNNDIVANAQRGNGGNITIDAEALFGIEQRPLNNNTNDINASSQVNGLDGEVAIDTPDVNPVRGMTELPSNAIQPEETTQQACQATNSRSTRNSLAISGKGGIPNEPGLPLSSLNLAGDDLNNYSIISPKPIKIARGEIQPARGIRVTKSGEIILTAYHTVNSGNRLPSIRICS